MTKRIRIPKLSSQQELERRIRKVWEVKPVTKVVPSKKLYSRREKRKGQQDDAY